ncbi:hypothetical protein Q5Z34_17390 [Listeria innocua]
MFNGTLKEAIAETFETTSFLYQPPRNKGNQIRYECAIELL